MAAVTSSSSSAAVDAGATHTTSSSSSSSDSGPAEGSSRTNTRVPRESNLRRTLDDVMREPSRRVPEVIVVDATPKPPRRRDVLDPREDLWLTTADGRYNSPIIPIRVGEEPRTEIFYVHKSVLLRYEYFERALCGEFRESGTQSIDFPEEDPAIFHFLVAYLYEGRYEPIKPAATVLNPDLDKGKGNVAAYDGADSDSDSSSISSDTDLGLPRRDRHRRRERERTREKHPGMHRPNCNCPQCFTRGGPPCWSCRAPRNPPPHMRNPYHAQPHIVNVDDDWLNPPGPNNNGRPPRRRNGNGNGTGPLPLPAPTTAEAAQPDRTTNPRPSFPPDPNSGRIAGEDLRTWLLTYELNLDVYILANRFLLEDFKKEIARAAIDMLETAGSDAAVVEVLFLCRKLYDGLPETDPLLKMIFARVAFLQPWRRAERETNEFLMANPEIAPLLLREMAARREEDLNGRSLPSMVRSWGYGAPPPMGAGYPYDGPGYGGGWRGGNAYNTGWPGVGMPVPPGQRGGRIW